MQCHACNVNGKKMGLFHRMPSPWFRAALRIGPLHLSQLASSCMFVVSPFEIQTDQSNVIFTCTFFFAQLCSSPKARSRKLQHVLAPLLSCQDAVVWFSDRVSMFRFLQTQEADTVGAISNRYWQIRGLCWVTSPIEQLWIFLSRINPGKTGEGVNDERISISLRTLASVSRYMQTYKWKCSVDAVHTRWRVEWMLWRKFIQWLVHFWRGAKWAFQRVTLRVLKYLERVPALNRPSSLFLFP